MIELNPLREIRPFWKSSEEVNMIFEILKKEAMKHIKQIDIDLNGESNADYLDKNKIAGLTATREWIKLFFDIDEGELE